MIEVHAEFPQREVIQAHAVVDNEEKTISEVIISAKPEITGVTASVDNETGTPYVDVTETGTGTDFSFDLAFHNLKGDKGEQGETGQTGNGIVSITKTATVGLEDDYTISFTNGTQTVFTVTNGADGQDGTDGTDGADGQAATVTVGTTTTGAAGTNASVVNSGTSSAAVFDFVIPRGDKGDTGNTGATGQDGFSPSASVSQSGGVTTISITDKNGTTTESIDLSDFGKVKSVNNTQPDANGDVTLTIPTVNDGILTITQNGTSKGTFSANQSINGTIALTDTTYNAFTGADGTNAGSSGLVPAPSATDNDKYLKGDGTWASVSGGSSTDVQINGTSITNQGVANIVTNTAYNASSNKIATMSDLPAGGANTDLSNLSATGEAHFLKSINSTNVTNALGYTPENQANKVTSISSSSTNTQYPSAKSVIELLKTIYPVGSVYLSTNSTCPLSSLFGTWTLVSSGRALWTGTGSNGNTTIAAGLPNIKGGVTQYKTTHTSGSSFSDGALAEIYNKTGGGYSSSNSKNVYNISFNAASSNSIYSDSVTTVQPPAYVVNVWRRTA